ncbi:MAG TPA: hypothetical protein P5064_05220 [Clostridia bacterium]|jgi:hypothetical protein|nr:hypothetical protein [Clostridiaceae bacterium]HOF27298.1 hypothetical protein [Clostridia bacterium]HOM34135.1 hypothetical protein [Clostridia bacterium]HOR90466.1 hypothetical protein [Clostridia bacterium]HOT70687.1 hypothetical protein [Clostridia bacterium]
MSKVRIGIFGVRRGSSVVRYCRTQPDAQLVAICDNGRYITSPDSVI